MKLYKARNVFSVVAHYALTFGVAAGSFILGSPWAIGAAVLLVAGMNAFFLKGVNDFMKDSLIRHPDVHRFSPNLGKIVSDLYKKSGLKMGKHPVYGFRVDEERMRKNGHDDSFLSQLYKELFNRMSKTHNAAASHFDKPLIMISEPLLKLLDDEEEIAVLAHEFTHAAAQHQKTSLLQRLSAGAAGFTNQITIALNTWATGWEGMLSAVGGKFGLALTTRLVHPKGKLLFTKDDELSTSEEIKKKNFSENYKIASQSLTTAILMNFSPVYLKVYLSARALSFGASVLNGTFSRSMEYQADRGAVELGANPLCLITALRKITEMETQRQREECGGKIPRANRLTKIYRRLTATHPALERRIGRLSAIARKNGFTEDQIRAAAEGEVDIPSSKGVDSSALRFFARTI